MKTFPAVVIAVSIAGGALFWTSSAFSNETIARGAGQPVLEAGRSRAQEMDLRKQEIARRVGMSAPLEASDAGEEDFVNIAVRDGLVVEASLEQVEAAMKAAAASPEREDDLAAIKLAHWGSYRYFLDEEGRAATHAE